MRKRGERAHLLPLLGVGCFPATFFTFFLGSSFFGSFSSFISFFGLA